MTPASSALPPPPAGAVVALLGAESTGKTSTAWALQARLREAGLEAVVVTEYLREFCEREGRTPHRHEQAEIARIQTERIAAARREAPLVLADTTALMTAIYSEILFGDTGLHESCRQAHAQVHLTLLMGLDLPWQADGLQRDGPHVREPVDLRVRRELAALARPYGVIYGHGPARADNAWRAVQAHLPGLAGRPFPAASAPAPRPEGADPRGGRDAARWQAWCRECLVPECEHRLFRGLAARR